MVEPASAQGGALRRLAGAAGLAYVAGVAIENMGILDAPTLGSVAADVRAGYDDQVLAVVTSFAGTFALLAYAVLAAALFASRRARAPPGEAWSVVGLVGGIGGPVVAAAGMAANALLLADRTQALSDETVVALHDLYLVARIVSGVFVALFLLGFGVASLRSGALPRALGVYACALSVPMTLAPLAAFTGDDPLRVAVSVAFGLQTLWIFLASMWLALAEGVSPLVLVRRAAFLLLALAAGLVGLGLLAAPGATGEFFAWGLGPEPLAAFAGGVYVGSALVYAISLRQPWRRVQGLIVGAVVLSVSVLIGTLAHLDQFDFDRLQAWAWLVLFAGFSALTIGLLALGDERRTPAARPLGFPLRAAFAAVAALLGALAVALWVDPGGLSGATPFELPDFGGRFAGSWIALLATLAGWSAWRGVTDPAEPAALALIALPAGAIVAGLRTVSDLEPAGTAAAYLIVLTLLAATGAALLAATRRAA